MTDTLKASSEALKPSFLQLPLSRVMERVSDGGNSIEELWKLFHGRAELEEKNIIFSLKASHLNIHQFEIPHSSSAHAVGLLKNYYVYTSRDQSLFHENLTDQIVKSLKETKAHSAAVVEHHKDLIRYAAKQSTAAQELLEKAKISFKKAEADLTAASEKLESLRVLECEEAERHLGDRRKEAHMKDKDGDRHGLVSMGSFSMNRILMSAFENTPAQDHEKQKKRFERRCVSVSQCLEDISVRKTLLLEALHEKDQVIGEALKVFQESELERLAETKKSLKIFCEIENKILVQKQKFLHDLEIAVDNMDCEGDMNLYINTERSVDSTFRYCKALSLLDFDYMTRKKENSNEIIKNHEKNMENEKNDEEKKNKQNIQIGKNSVDNGGSRCDLLSNLQTDFLNSKEAKAAKNVNKVDILSGNNLSAMVLPDNNNDYIDKDNMYRNIKNNNVNHDVLENYSDSKGKNKDRTWKNYQSSSHNNDKDNKDDGNDKNDKNALTFVDDGLSPDSFSSSPSSSPTSSNNSPSSSFSFPSSSTSLSPVQPPSNSNTTHATSINHRSFHSPTLSPSTFPPNYSLPSSSSSSSLSPPPNPPSFSLTSPSPLPSTLSPPNDDHIRSSTALLQKINRVKSSQNYIFGTSSKSSNSNSNSMKNVLNNINGDNDMKNNKIGVYNKNNHYGKSNSEELQGWELALAEAEKEGSPLQKREREVKERGEREARNANEARETRGRLREAVTGVVEEGVGGESSSLTIGTKSKTLLLPVMLKAKAMSEGFITAKSDTKEGYSTSHSENNMNVDGNVQQKGKREMNINYDVTHNSNHDYEARVEEIVSIVFDMDSADSYDVNDTDNIANIPGIEKRDVNDSNKNHFNMDIHNNNYVGTYDPEIILKQRYIKDKQNRDADNNDFSVLGNEIIHGDRDKTGLDQSDRYNDNGYITSQESKYCNNKYFPSEESLFDLFTVKAARTILLQKLDGRRCSSGRLTGRGFVCMTLLMKVFLDCCSVPEDVQSAMRIINMSNTFHRLKDTIAGDSPVPVPSSAKATDSTSAPSQTPSSAPAPAPSSYSHPAPISYLCCEEALRTHPIWQVEGIWEAALSEGVSAQIRCWALDPVLWDELGQEALKEAVIGVHNIIFGQLATIAFTMREIGLPDTEVRRKVISMCRESELSEEQEHLLLKTLKRDTENTIIGAFS